MPKLSEKCFYFILDAGENIEKSKEDIITEMKIINNPKEGNGNPNIKFFTEEEYVFKDGSEIRFQVIIKKNKKDDDFVEYLEEDFKGQYNSLFEELYGEDNFKIKLSFNIPESGINLFNYESKLKKLAENSDENLKNGLKKELKKIIKTSIFEVNEEVQKEETLSLVYRAFAEYSDDLGAEKRCYNEKAYSILGMDNIEAANGKRLKYYDMCSSLTLLIGEIMKSKKMIDGHVSFDKINEALNNNDNSNNLDNCKMPNIFEIQEAAKLFYSIGNFIPMYTKISNTQKAGIGLDIFDLYIQDERYREELLWYIKNEDLFMMPMEYYTVIKDKDFLDKIIKNSKAIHGEKDGGLKGILELYNFFNLRIKLRGAKIISRLVQNDNDMVQDNKEKMLKVLKEIEEDYDKRLRTSIKKLNVYMAKPIPKED